MKSINCASKDLATVSLPPSASRASWMRTSSAPIKFQSRMRITPPTGGCSHGSESLPEALARSETEVQGAGAACDQSVMNDRLQRLHQGAADNEKHPAKSSCAPWQRPASLGSFLRQPGPAATKWVPSNRLWIRAALRVGSFCSKGRSRVKRGDSRGRSRRRGAWGPKGRRAHPRRLSSA